MTEYDRLSISHGRVFGLSLADTEDLAGLLSASDGSVIPLPYPGRPIFSTREQKRTWLAAHKRVPAPAYSAQERWRVADAKWLRARLWRRVGSVAFLFGWIAIHWWFGRLV